MTVPVAIAALLAARWGVNFDVRYVLGGLRAGEAGGAGSYASIFVHRPLAYRALAAALDVLPSRLPDPTGVVAEVVLRGEALLLAAAASMLLLLGIRRRRPGLLGPGRGRCGRHGTGVGTGLDFPGIGLGRRAVRGGRSGRCAVAAAVAGMAGGALLVLSAAVKITTAHEQHDPVNVHGQRTDRAPANTPGRERLSQT